MPRATSHHYQNYQRMGNALGSAAYLGIEIENNGSVCAGGKMRGKLLLDVRKATSADFLMFHFYGYERTKIIYTTSHTSTSFSHTQNANVTTTSTTTHTCTERVDLFSSEVVLHRFAGGSVAKGRYAFPFEVSIPSGLPGTQSFSDNGDYCGIEYHCGAKLHRNGMFKWEVQNSCEVLLNDEPYESFPVPLYLGPGTSNMTFMDMFQRGTLTFGGKVNTSNACGNEKIRVNYAISNESTSRVKALEFDITCIISFRAQTLSRNFRHNIFHKRIKVANVGGAEPMRRIGERKIDAVALLHQLDRGEYGVDIPISKNIRSTYNSAIASITYELSMTIMTTYGSKNATISVPIIMHRHGANFTGVVPKIGEAFPMPKGWTGIIVPTAEVILDEPAVALPSDYDTVQGLTRMVKESNQWKETNVLLEWIAHSPYHANLLTPASLYELFRSIEGDYSVYAFCRAIGEAMNSPSSSNKCTCSHIAQAARAVTMQMSIAVCTLFGPYCTDVHNAYSAFGIIGLGEVEMSTVMMNYR